MGHGPGPVLIVGVSTRALAESASRAGHACVSVDAFGDLDQKALVENVGLARDMGRPYSAMAAVAVGRRWAAKSAAYVGNLENHPAAVRRLALDRRLLGNSPATLLRVRDPMALAETVRRAGGRLPLTLLPSQAREASTAMRWLRKPRCGGGGSGVRAWAPGTPLGRHEVLQQHVEGILASAAFVADGRRAFLLGISRGLAGDPAFGARGYRYCGSLYPFSVEPALRERLGAIAEAATTSFGLVGLNGMDFVLSGGEAFVLEINPRYSASMELLERAGGFNAFEAHDAACGGLLPRAQLATPGGVWGKAVVYAQRDVTIGDSARWLARDDIRDVPSRGDRIRRGQPLCTVFARSADSAECYARLAAAAASLQREVGAGRRT